MMMIIIIITIIIISNITSEACVTENVYGRGWLPDSILLKFS